MADGIEYQSAGNDMLLADVDLDNGDRVFAVPRDGIGEKRGGADLGGNIFGGILGGD